MNADIQVLKLKVNNKFIELTIELLLSLGEIRLILIQEIRNKKQEVLFAEIIYHGDGIITIPVTLTVTSIFCQADIPRLLVSSFHCVFPFGTSLGYVIIKN